MSFSITIGRDRADAKYQEPSVTGVIQIGQYVEEFVVSLLQWSIDDYVSQWKYGLSRILEKRKSCLIGSMRNLNNGDFVNLWILYRIDSKVYFQNRIVLPDEAGQFSVEDIYSGIEDRVTVNPEGYKISEWMVSSKEINDFMINFDKQVFNLQN